MTLNLFYDEPDGDRWLPLDRYPRQFVRRLVRGRPQPSGHTRVFLNLCAGLKKIGVRYRINDYRHAQRHPEELACIIGKPFLLEKMEWKNPILFGAATFSHPIEHPNLLERHDIRKIVLPGQWMRDMWAPYWGDLIATWPTGIDTDHWAPCSPQEKDIDVLLYDKVRWEHERYEATLIEPVRETTSLVGEASMPRSTMSMNSSLL